MEIKSALNGTQLDVTLLGRLDTLTAPDFADFLKTHLTGVTAMVLDLGGVDYVSSAGLRVILTIQKALPAPGAFKLVKVNPEVMEVFEMTGFADILTIEK